MSSVSKQFTLGKHERLKSRKQIEKLFAEGKSFNVNPYKIYYAIDEILNDPRSMFNVQFGVGVSARNFKKAVNRNRIKRLTREAWRLQKNELKELAKGLGRQVHIFFIYTGKDLPDFVTIKDKVAVVLKKLVAKLNENDPANS